MDEKEGTKSIFVSYGRESHVTQFVKTLKRDLEANGFSVWLDTESIPSGKDWHGAIGTGLQDCVAIIPVITRKYIDSRFCMNELYTADGDKKMIFPIMYENVDLASTESGRALKFIVSGINWTMFRTGLDDYSDSLQKLIEGMKERMREKVKEAEKAAQVAKTKEVVISVGPSSSVPLKMIGGIQYPAGIATSRNGEIVVASYMGHKVHIYSSDYTLLRTFGSNGYMDGQFMCPSGIAIDRQNRVFVSSMTKVDVFTMEGQFLNAAGRQGNGPLQFTNAAGVAVGKGGEVYVVDTQNNRVQVLNSDLTYRTSFSEASPSLGSGYLSQPQAIAINSEGNLYVADMMNHAVQAFTPEGKFILRFGTYGQPTTPGTICSPMAITIDRQDNVYVSSGTGYIAIFDKDGNFLRQFGSYGSELGQFSQIKGMHIDKKGRLYVSDGTANRIQIFPGSTSMVGLEEEVEEEEETTTNKPESTDDTTAIGLSKPAYLIGPKSSTPIKILLDIENAGGVAVGKNGEVIVAGFSEHKVFVYDAKNDYHLMAEIGKEGHFDGEFYYPSGLVVTPDNYVLVSSHNKLQWFTMEGNLVHAVGNLGKDEMEFDNPVDVTVGRDGRIYVLDSNNKRVQIFNGDATFHSSFGFPFLAKEDDTPPSALAINSEGKLFFTDPGNNCVHVFTLSGEPLFKFGKSGSWMERGVLTKPMAIAIDNADNVFVGSIMMISIFDKSGSFIRAFGGHGSDPGQFTFIKGLHIDTCGNLYVSEWSNNRVQIFEGSEPSTSSKEDTQPVNFTSLSRKPAYMVGPSSMSPIKVLSDIPEAWGVAEGKKGEVIVASKKQNKVFVYSSQDDYKRVVEIGERGSSDGKFLSPLGVAVTSENLVLVTSQDKLQWFTMEGKLVYAVGGTGTEEMKFNNPTGIAVSKEGRIYVIDEKNKRVQILNGDATYISCFGFPHLTGPKDEPPCVVAVNSEGTLYFADSKNNCIHAYSSSGKPLFNFGKSGSWLERGMFKDPVALAIDAEDNVFVGDCYKISIFDKSGSLIRVLPHQFNRIKGLFVGKNGCLYVSDYYNNCVQIYEGSLESTEMCEQVSDECIGILSARRPIFTVGPNSDKPFKVLANIAEPWGVTTASNGDIFVVSRKDKKVLVYDGQNYDFKEDISKLYWETTRDNEIVLPTGITVCEDDCLLLNLRNQLAKIDMEGEVLASVGKKGRSGRSEEELDSPNGIALGKDGRVYVVDTGNNRVQIFNPDLSYSGTFCCPDNLRRPGFRKVAVNSHGNVYVTDNSENCIRVFSPDGKYLFSFGKKGNSSDREATNSPVAIAIDHEDYVYVSRSDVIVSIFDREGTFVRAFGERGEEEGQFRDITAMHIDKKGNLYICESRNNRVQIFAGIKSLEVGEKDRVDLLDKEEEKFKATLPATVLPDIIQEPHGVAEGKNGEIVVISSSDNKVFVYDNSYKLTVQFGGKGDLDGYFQNPTGVAVTSDNYILVSSHDKLQWFTMEGQLVYAVGSNGKGEIEFDHPDDISVGRDGRIYVLEKQNERVQILKGNGTYDGSFSLKMDYPPEALAVNNEGKVFLVDTTNNCIRIYSSDGLYLSKFNSMGSNQLTLPTAIAIDTNGSIYVGTVTGIVATFDKEGCFVDAFRGSGDVPGQFNVIRGLHVGQSEQIYVSDVTNNKVQIFGHHNPLATSPVNLDTVTSPSKVLPYRPAFTVGPKSCMPFKILTGIKHPSGITTDLIGNIYVASDRENEIIVFSSAASEPQSRIKEIQNPRNPREKRISSPSGLTFTDDGFLLVSFKHQLVKMSSDGKAEMFFGNEKNRSGKTEQELNDPGGIALGQDGRIYVVDRGNHRIQILQSNFDYMKSYSNPDERERSGEYLEDAAINSNGDLIVTDRRNYNVQVFNQKGRFLFTFGKRNTSSHYKRGQLSHPNAIAVDQEDYVYVGDESVVSIFDKKGKFVRSFGGKGDQPGQFRDIKGMHIDGRGRLYVSDWYNNRVQVFQ